MLVVDPPDCGELGCHHIGEAGEYQFDLPPIVFMQLETIRIGDSRSERR